jgi:hypothetical protein
MNYRKMKRKDFINKGCTCGAMSIIGLFNIDRIYAQENSTKKDNTDGEPIYKNQVRQLLKFIDSSVKKSDKKRIFSELGIECFYNRSLDKWVVSFKDNQEEFFNRVNRGESKYWEKLEYDKEKSVITLVGRIVQSCACEFGQCDQPPKSLCNYCCKRFQEEIFCLLLEKKVNVRIDESVILGGERCSTTIFVG